MKMGLAYWFLIFMVCDAYGFLLKCPTPSHRQLRAKVLCQNPATYLCLHDDIRGGYSENCTRVTLEQPGKVTTLNYKGNFDNRPCSTNLYQPRYIPYWTNVSTDCIYQKSSCKEQGQVEYDYGGVQSDRTCTCDYTRGYAFVKTPRDPCFCKPSREDCSCYIKTYLNDSISGSNDMDCSFPFNKTASHVLLRGTHNDLSLVPTKQLEETRKNATNFRQEIHFSFIWNIGKQKNVLTGLVIIICIILVLLTTLLYYATLEKTYGCYNLKRLTNKYLFKAFVIRPFEKSLECFEGNSFSLECEISVGTVRCFKGFKDITDRWRFNRKKSGFHYEFYISAMKRGDSDTYSIRTESGSILTETFLRCKNNVIESPPDTVVCVEGSRYILTWKMRSGEVQLYKNGKMLENFSKSENIYTYTVKSMLQDAEGKYTLRNENGYIFTSTQLIFKRNVVECPPGELKIAIGEGCTLQWKLLYGEVQLYKDNEVLSRIDYCTRTEMMYIFTLPCVSEGDRGEYTLRNENGHIFSRTVIRAACTQNQLTNQVPENITCRDEVFCVLQWKVPSKEVKLYKDGKFLNNTENVQNKNVDKISTFVVPSMAKEDEGDYFLKKGNDVLAKSRLHFKPVFESRLEDKKIMEGLDVCFDCKINVENDEIDWFKDDIKIGINHDRYIKHSHNGTHTLTIKDTDLKDTGVFAIVVSNRTRTANLNVEEMPKEIKEMEQQARKAFLTAVKGSSTVPRRYIRVMIVGKSGAGKTSLLKRLLKQKDIDLTNTPQPSTEGINREIWKCQIDALTGTWTYYPAVFESRLEDKEIMEGLNVCFECKVNVENDEIDWFKDDIKIGINHDRYIIDIHNGTHSLTIKDTDLKDTGICAIIVSNRTRTANLNVEEMPKEIKEIEQPARKAFLMAVKKSSTVHRRYLRVMIVGKSGAGKTTLLRQLLEQKDIDFTNTPYVDLTITPHASTDGINIEIWKCQIDIPTGEWTYFPEQNNTMEKILNSNPNVAHCGFWDFAGQKEYYATHQTFLTSNALYVLVVDMSEKFTDKTVEKQTKSDFNTTGDYIDFWFNNIHCYAVEKHVLDDKELQPPILLVGSCIDKIEGDLLQKRRDFNTYLDKFVCQERTRNHIMGDQIYFMSNYSVKMKGSQFDEIKKHITTFAQNTKPSNLPVKWIFLEKVLSLRNDEVISYAELEELAKENHVDIELDPFLQYEHDIGNIVFFEDIKDYVILNQQWLVDAFKCLVNIDTAIFKKKTECKYLKANIQRLLSIKCQERKFEDKLEYLIKIFEKFDIIVKPDTTNVNSYYYIPCLMEANLTKDIWNNFVGKSEEYVATSWLYIELEFLPPALFNHVLARFVQKYKMCTYNDKPALFKKMGIFYLDDNKWYRLAINASLDTIALQVLERKKDKYSYCKLREHLISIVHKLFKRYKMRLSYKLKLGCSKGPYYSKTGRLELPEIIKATEKSEYFCEEHKTKHLTKNFYSSWFGKTLPIESFSNKLTEKGEQIQHICEFCSCQRYFRCENCQQDMCCECFDKHQPVTKTSHSGVIYDKFVLEGIFDLFGTFSYFTDMVVLSDGLLVLLDLFGNLFTYDINGVNLKEISYPNTGGRCHNLTVIDNDTVAILSFINVWIVEVRRKGIFGNVTLNPFCSGIMIIDNMLYVGCEEEDARSASIHVLDISELKVQKTIPVSYKPQCLRYGHNGRIYCLTNTCVIVIYDMNWNELFTMEDLYILYPLSIITVDNDGNALSLSHTFKGCVIKITPNGKAVPVQSVGYLSSEDFGVLSFHTESRRLFYCFNNKISIYKTK